MRNMPDPSKCMIIRVLGDINKGDYDRKIKEIVESKNYLSF